MSYISRYGRRPNEYASKSSHTYIINDEKVKSYLNTCDLPKEASEVELDKNLIYDIEYPQQNPIEHFIAIDGGYTTVAVKKSFPSSTISFFQFGALFFKLKDLEDIDIKPFIAPEDIARLKELERIKLVIPTKNISLKGSSTLIYSVRKTIYDFFSADREGYNYIDTLKWFLFQEYNKTLSSYQLANCPECGTPRIDIKYGDIRENHTFDCPLCKREIFLTDAFRLHEAIDNELGAGGILGYLVNLIEQFLIIHTIKIILDLQPSVLKKTFFIKDGPLAFFGQTANMHKSMRHLCNYLFDKYDLCIAGLEKSGIFVEHADEISEKLKPGQYLLLSNEYIYKHILPGDPDTNEPYARTSYYGSKLIFKSKDKKMYVATLPTANEKVVLSPTKDKFKNIDIILMNVEKLRCDMYDNSLFPIALANKLVSLSDHPSSMILEKFAKESVH